MLWKPQFPPTSFHPAQLFDFSVAEVSAPDGGPVGHLLVFAEPYAEQTGHLWWKRLSEPVVTLEFWSSIHGEFEDPMLFDDQVDATVEGLQHGVWQHDDAQDVSTTYLLRWLDRDESRKVSAEVFGLDLAAERRRRKRPE